jgi:hypothetical protein
MTMSEARIGLVISLVAALLSAGVAWGTTQAQLRDTVPRSAFVSDSIATAARLERVESTQSRELAEISAKLDRIDSRVSQIYCAGKPTGCR